MPPTLPEFQPTNWINKLRLPDWYNHLESELNSALFAEVEDTPERKARRHQIYDLTGEMLEANEIPFASTGPDLDSERQSPNTLVIHHTADDSAMPLTTLSAVGLLRQYGFQYLQNDVMGRAVRGEPVWSGHFRQGRMVFFAYHWLIRPDGSYERLLADGAIGWHAGNWEINTRSIALALAGNYQDTTPPDAQLEAAARVIQQHYSRIPHERILGHREVRPELTCPGDHFLHGWKAQLIGLL